jgi:2-keto-3-deoxy-L-rhamnonate aldolase RhmA
LKNQVRAKLGEGETAFGTWINSSSPSIVDYLRHLEFDWFLIDAEHALLNPETLSHMVQLVQDSHVTPFVRVGLNDQYLIKVALDCGAHGVVVPLINSPEEAGRAVSFSRYPPRGVRGVGPVRAHRYGLDFREYLATASEEVMVIGQIETVQALERLDEILEVEGLDVAFFGPSDMTVSMGLMDERTNPRVLDAMRTVVAACKKHGKVPGVLATSQQEARTAIELGFRFVGLASDMRFVADGANAYLRLVGRKS